jgi:hypothetical protein
MNDAMTAQWFGPKASLRWRLVIESMAGANYKS